MRITITEKMRERARRRGSVLKLNRIRIGGPKGAIAAGITLLVFGLFSGLPFLIQGFFGGILLFAMMGIPGLILLIIGSILKKKRARDYLEFYVKETGYSRRELLQAEDELLAPQTVAFGNSGKNGIFCYITEHFLVSVTKEACYVRKLSDMVAVFYSEEIPGIDGQGSGVMFISERDISREPCTNPYTYRLCGGYSNILLDRQSCVEVQGEIEKRGAVILTNQRFSDGKTMYDLLNLNHWEEDWTAIRQALQQKDAF